jgi:two-component system, OmpR family, response regulator
MPDLIVVGISMYECNGFNASLTRRNDPDTRDIANVAFTTFDAHEVRPHLVDRRFDG